MLILVPSIAAYSSSESLERIRRATQAGCYDQAQAAISSMEVDSESEKFQVEFYSLKPEYLKGDEDAYLDGVASGFPGRTTMCFPHLWVVAVEDACRGPDARSPMPGRKAGLRLCRTEPTRVSCPPGHPCHLRSLQDWAVGGAYRSSALRCDLRLPSGNPSGWRGGGSDCGTHPAAGAGILDNDGSAKHTTTVRGFR